ncbi:MAG TPA: glycoside hydrolase family 5 protein [Polyangiaceae bacterium]
MLDRRTTFASFTLALTLACDPGGSAAPVPEPVPEFPEADWLAAGTPVAAFGQLRTSGKQMVSESGEPTRLRGVSSMWLNWETDGYAQSRDALEWMRDNWQISVIRAAMGVEPDGAYLSNPALAEEQVRAIVDAAIELGLYVLIDWHDHNALDHQAQAEEFFEKMATDYGEYPNVLYEPFNEPLAVDWSRQLKPYHEAVVARIRAVDPDNIIVLGTPTWCQDVDAAAQDPVSGENLMYTLHFYACSHGATGRNKGSAALGRGLPLFVTEWGATGADGGVADPAVCDSEADEWHQWMRLHLVSWAAWKLDGCTDASCLLRAGAPLSGGWTDEWLQGHGPYVREKLLE